MTYPNNKNFYLTLLGLGILLIGALSLFIFTNKFFKNEPPKTPIKVIEAPQPLNPMTDSKDLFVTSDKCQKIASSSQKDFCYARASSSLAAASNNILLCLGISDFGIRQDCIYNQANLDTDPKACNRIASKKLKEACLEMKSLANLDTKFCDIIDNDELYERQECFDRLAAFKAEKSGDINSCTSIKTLEYNSLCMDKSARQGASCEEITDLRQKELCISRREFAKAKSNLDCEKIKTENYRKVCLAAIANIDNKNYKFDDDNDNLNNSLELWISTDPFKSDTDGDGLSDFDEYQNFKTDPTASDTDADGISDSAEIANKTDPKVGFLKASEPISTSSVAGQGEKWWSDYGGTGSTNLDWKKDSDSDGLIDIDEIFYLTNPFSPDTDGDGVLDGKEIRLMQNPLGTGDLDFDSDGLSDKMEIKLGTNPTLKDSNGDGVLDGVAVKNGSEAVSDDSDGDGLKNIYERKIGTDAFKADTDGDGHGDGEEVNSGFNPCGEGKLPPVKDLLAACSPFVMK
jgi:hypothetical protein